MHAFYKQVVPLQPYMVATIWLFLKNCDKAFGISINYMFYDVWFELNNYVFLVVDIVAVKIVFLWQSNFLELVRLPHCLLR